MPTPAPALLRADANASVAPGLIAKSHAAAPAPTAARPALRAAASGAERVWRVAPAARQLSGSAIREVLKLTERPEILSFAGGLPNPSSFPLEALRAAAARVLTEDAAGALQYGPTEGFGPLREQVAARLTRAGQPCTAAEVLITTGSQQALDLIGKALLHPGATLLAANPSYLGALQAFALQQPRLLDLEAWAGGKRAGHSAAAPACCYLTPTFANPSGETLDLAARRALLERLDAAAVPLIEDDAYGELWLDAPPPPSCRSLAPESTLYLGSFSKILAPGLRVGYVAGPKAVIGLLTRLKQAADLHTPGLDQRIVSALLADGTLEAHLPKLRALYRDQRDVLLAALDRHFRPYARWSVPTGGMFAWLELTGELDACDLFDAALAHQVAFVPGAPFYFGPTDPSTLRLAFSTLRPEQIELGIERLATAASRFA